MLLSTHANTRANLCLAAIHTATASNTDQNVPVRDLARVQVVAGVPVLASSGQQFVFAHQGFVCCGLFRFSKVGKAVRVQAIFAILAFDSIFPRVAKLTKIDRTQQMRLSKRYSPTQVVLEYSSEMLHALVQKNCHEPLFCT